MRNLTENFVTEKNKPENRPIYLYTIYAYNGTDNLYFAGYDVDVTFPASGGQTYTAFPIVHEQVNENAEGQIDLVRLRVGNANRLLQGYLEANDFRGLKVDITLIFMDRLASSSDKTVETFYVDSYTVTEEAGEFLLSSQFDVQDVEIPRRKFLRNYCQWRFKGDECGYSGGETTCNKTKQDCKDNKNNYARFGGFPSIPQHRINF